MGQSANDIRCKHNDILLVPQGLYNVYMRRTYKVYLGRL